ncbi:Cyclic nucleotide-binding protein [Pseudocohnilembus persalinus]|uniref:Cyclic nucleotide-binding protein n=1 Tax=Pseudocohnilembus persalinus TaxID=266149 RepID=A0A0V0R3T5_PSEPJ|nr:Cyclic nucleotide-binding protein [Pseudocohnilembus persalinus]|eukprot:KRX09050.1 Cyclic nucleotide-binding protein [Pseudocohnilembus persalinus]
MNLNESDKDKQQNQEIRQKLSIIDENEQKSLTSANHTRRNSVHQEKLSLLNHRQQNGEIQTNYKNLNRQKQNQINNHNQQFELPKIQSGLSNEIKSDIILDLCLSHKQSSIKQIDKNIDAINKNIQQIDQDNKYQNSENTILKNIKNNQQIQQKITSEIESDNFESSEELNEAKKYVEQLMSSAFSQSLQKSSQILQQQNLFQEKNILTYNDKSHFITSPIKVKKGQFYTFLVQKLNIFPVIFPSQKKKIILDIWLGLLIVIRMFFQSVKVGFCWFNIRECVEVFNNYVLGVMLLSSMLEMALNFNSGYYKKGVLITDKRKIIKNYVKGALFPDILAQIPLVYNLFIDSHSHQNKLLIVAVLFHFQALIGKQYFGYTDTWIDLQYKLDQNDWKDFYFFSFYWSVSTMATILLFMPDNRAELLFSILSIFALCGVFGYALNTIGMILQEINKNNYKQKKERALINKFIDRKNITRDLKLKIQNYVDYLHEQQKNSIQEEMNCAMQILPKDIKQDMLNQIYKTTIKEFSIISSLFSIPVQNQCMNIIEEVFYTPGEYVYKENESTEPYLYLLQSGSLQLSYKLKVQQQDDQLESQPSIFQSLNTQIERVNQFSRPIMIQKLKGKQQFGEIEFFTAQRKLCNVLCLEACQVYRISRTNFVKILKTQNMDFEIFYMIKDLLQQKIYANYLQPQNFQLTKCYLCKSSDHHFHICPNFTYTPNKKKLIKEYQSIISQQRKTDYKRNQRNQKFQSLANLELVQMDQEDIVQEDNIAEYIEDYYQILGQYRPIYYDNISLNERVD